MLIGDFQKKMPAILSVKFDTVLCLVRNMEWHVGMLKFAPLRWSYGDARFLISQRVKCGLNLVQWSIKFPPFWVGEQGTKFSVEHKT